ncbi:MAG TPA: flagellar motor protein MotB [bacterium]|nr:flagellar motor protein MotB [bacterium]
MKRVGPPAEPESAGMMRWLLTYADMITLLLALFILLYAMSTTNQTRFQEAVRSVRTAFGAPGGASATDTRAAPGVPSSGPIGPGPKPLASAGRPQPVAPRPQMGALVQAIRDAGLQQHVHVLEANAGIVIRLQDDVLFDTGTADLRPEAAPVITRVAALLKSLQGYSVRVEGYTDARPIATPAFPSNWELSAGRALSVLHALAEDGVDPSGLSASGYGPYHPVATNETPEGQAENRRVEIVVSRLVEQVAP